MTRCARCGLSEDDTELTWEQDSMFAFSRPGPDTGDYVCANGCPDDEEEAS